tara:strand:+ start:3765 stop:4145 length:381 start_codon:yes stop_codon:yes gene_type:complete
MIQLKQKTPSQIKQEKYSKQKKESIIKTFVKKYKNSSNINFFDSDKSIYHNLEQQNKKKYIFKDSIPVFIIIGLSIIFIFITLYLNFNSIIKSNTDTFIFIFLIVSLFSITSLILLKNIFIDSKFK